MAKGVEWRQCSLASSASPCHRTPTGAAVRRRGKRISMFLWGSCDAVRDFPSLVFLPSTENFPQLTKGDEGEKKMFQGQGQDKNGACACTIYENRIPPAGMFHIAKTTMIQGFLGLLHQQILCCCKNIFNGVEAEASVYSEGKICELSLLSFKFIDLCIASDAFYLQD